MTIDINQDWVTDELVIDLYDEYNTEKGANIKASSIRKFLAICASAGTTDSADIPVDENNYPTGNILIEIITYIYYVEWFMAFTGTMSEKEDVYWNRIGYYNGEIDSLKGSLNKDLIENGDDARPDSYWSQKPIEGF
jgi:hypothetical protein